MPKSLVSKVASAALALATVALVAMSFEGFASAPAAASLSSKSSAAPVADATPLSSELNLDAYYTPLGILGTFVNGQVADPYFGLISIEKANKAGMNTQKVEDRFIEWALANQQADGRFHRYCVKDGEWQSCGRTDSDDATLSRWLQLMARRDAPVGKEVAWNESFQKTEAMLFSLLMDNGIFSVFPHDLKGYKGYALFKDNMEVLNAFEGIAKSSEERGNLQRAAKYAAAAKDLRAAMKVHFGDDPFNMKALALGAKYRGVQFYPHQVAVPLGWSSGYFAAPTKAGWTRWLSETRQAWEDNAKKDFPWGSLAVAAQEFGLMEEGTRWLSQYSENRAKLQRWNILEEASAQILEFREAKANAAAKPAAKTQK